MILSGVVTELAAAHLLPLPTESVGAFGKLITDHFGKWNATTLSIAALFRLLGYRRMVFIGDPYLDDFCHAACLAHVVFMRCQYV
jgi:hypothetical protein